MAIGSSMTSVPQECKMSVMWETEEGSNVRESLGTRYSLFSFSVSLKLLQEHL